MFTYTCAGAALVLASIVEGHIAMYNKGLFGYNWPNQASEVDLVADPAFGLDADQVYNGNRVVAPLRQSAGLTEEMWFGHGMKGYPPVEGDFMELVSGSNYTAELACNRVFTSMRNPNVRDPLPYYACPNDKGPLHTMNVYGKPPAARWFGGSSIAISYSSDANASRAADFTVISVNSTSVWTRETIYQIPANMPKCPAGGCLCTWNWLHLAGNGEGYGAEIYNNLYRCTVSGQTNDDESLTPGEGKIPTFCANNTESCTLGAKQPMYLFQLSGNNMPKDNHGIPTYNARYGFKDGAQTDIFLASNTTSDKPQGSASRSLPAVMGLLLAPVAAVVVQILL